MTVRRAQPLPRSPTAEDERYTRFDRLQQGMAGVWDVMRLNQASESVVVIPSVTLRSGSMGQAFEERFLFLLLLLRQPRLRMIYVTSMPIQSAIVEYYLALLRCHPESRPGPALAGVGGRLVAGVLSEKLLERPGCYAGSPS